MRDPVDAPRDAAEDFRPNDSLRHPAASHGSRLDHRSHRVTHPLRGQITWLNILNPCTIAMEFNYMTADTNIKYIKIRDLYMRNHYTSIT